MSITEIFRGALTGAKWRELGRYLEESQVTSGPGIRVRKVGNRVILSARRGRGGGGGAEAPKPLTLRAGTTAAKLQVVPGYANSIMPTLATVALDAETPPEITVTADIWFWLKCVGTFGVSDSYVFTIETSATSAVPTGTAITGTGFVSYLLIGAAAFADDAATITQNRLGGDVGVESFGANNLWWQL